MKYKTKVKEGRFLKVICNKCRASQVVYGKASTIVKCLKCGAIIAEPRSSKAKIKARVIAILK